MCWAPDGTGWYEIFELFRKLLLTSLGTALGGGDTPFSQLLIKIAVSFFFLLVFVRHSPFKASEVDIIVVSSQLCTLLTLMHALCIKIGFFEAEGISPEAMAATLVLIQVVPFAVAIFVIGWLIYALYGDLVAEKLHEMSEELHEASEKLHEMSEKASASVAGGLQHSISMTHIHQSQASPGQSRSSKDSVRGASSSGDAN